MVMGGIVPVINLDGVAPGELVLDGPTLAAIFLGTVKSWDDPAIKKLNPNVKLPSQAIAVVHRSDGSGTTFNFSYYLAEVSPDWKSKVGSATSVEWPVGIGAKGNEGVSNNVSQTKGSIGYVEYAYAKQNKMTYTKMVNKDGKTVAPTGEAFQAAAANPDARSVATSGRGSGVVGYNVQIAVEANHHLIVMHEVTNDGTDRSQLSHVANETKAALGVEKLDAVADRGYFNSEEIWACEEAGITVTLPKPMTSNAKAEGRFGKQDFRYVADEDIYVCPAGEKLAYHYTTEENRLVLRRYWTNVCQSCAIKPTCTTGKERRITRWEHEHILEAVQRRLDEHPEKMRQRRETVEHPFGTIKARMGATHFLMKTLPRVASEMALHVLA